MTEHKDSQPKPASVEGIKSWIARCHADGDLSATDAMQAVITEQCQAITQQAEALAQALAEVERLRTVNADQYGALDLASRECTELRAQLMVALQYDGELPPLQQPYDLLWDDDLRWDESEVKDYARQAIANDRAKRVPQYLCNGMRFKVAVRNGEAMLPCLPDELNGRWVAFVAAEDDCHLLAAAPSPKETL